MNSKQFIEQFENEVLRVVNEFRSLNSEQFENAVTLRGSHGITRHFVSGLPDARNDGSLVDILYEEQDVRNYSNRERCYVNQLRLKMQVFHVDGSVIQATADGFRVEDILAEYLSM
jgi:hypothetical protein